MKRENERDEKGGMKRGKGVKGNKAMREERRRKKIVKRRKKGEGKEGKMMRGSEKNGKNEE